MGFLQNRWLEQSELGFNSPDWRYVCDDCVADYALKQLIHDEASESTCDFCGRHSDSAIAADTDGVLAHIGRSLNLEWSDPVGLLYFDSEDQRWVGDVFDFEDVVAEEPVWPFADEKFERFVVDAFLESQWTPNDPGGLDEAEALRYSWELFGETVKHETRFLFVLIKNDPRLDEPGAPLRLRGKMLEELGGLINQFGLITTLNAGTALFRVRVHDRATVYTTAKDLGTPPRDKASQSRMSPAGIPMFYGAEDADTVLAETVDASHTEGKVATVATFRTTTDCRIVDLDLLGPVPSIFDHSSGARETRPKLGFLHGFRRDISRPIDRDDRIHIEYVPTQAVTEYIRHLLRDADGRAFDGLAYESAQRPGSRNVVLFVDNDHCLEEGEKQPFNDGLCLELIHSERRDLGLEWAGDSA